MSSANIAASLNRHLDAGTEFARVQSLLPEIDCDFETINQIVDAAAAFSSDVLAPLNRQIDSAGVSIEDGRVRLHPDHHAAWTGFVEGGWTTLEGNPKFGGAGLPSAVHAVCEELFNRACPAFGMLPTPIRCAARVLEKYADAAICEEWLPHLVAGTWGATICISEAGAGSDVPRLRTAARRAEDGDWRISGEKMWISFGDHDLTERIGHLVLAKVAGADAGTAGLSLFLVPDTISNERNAVSVRRVEEKLGLHGSPTCELEFDGAKGWLIGEEGRGLGQLFTMIIGMRLSVGSQGAGIAGAAASLAWSYAAERRQGGPASEPPVTIDEHGDVRRMLLDCAARAEMARGLVVAASLAADLQALETDPDAKQTAGHLLAWLLPITKNFCAEAAFSCANEAIQILGGAGYTREWEAEQYLRDARVLSIYEGTSGMQALDLTLRRTLGDNGRSIDTFLEKARSDLAACADEWASNELASLLELLAEARQALSRENAKTAAYPFLQLASIATTGWIALRLLGQSEAGANLAPLCHHWLRIAAPMARAELDRVRMGNDLTKEFDILRS